MGCGNAAGEMIKPLVIFKGKRTNEALQATAPSTWRVKFTDNGWWFAQWFAQLLIPFVEGKRAEAMKPSHPALLLLDGHSSHETLYTLAKENKIIIICLPPHMTHLLQPMDVSFFKSLKSAWDQECEAYARDPANGGKFVTKPTFCSVLSKAWQKTSSRKENVTNGFRKCGIFPVKKMTLEELTPQRKLNPADALQRAGPETQDEDIHDTTNEQTDKSTGETTAQTETSTEETPETTEQTETSTEETPETTEQTETSSEETPETTAQTETSAEESPETTAQTETSTDESPETTEQKETSTEETLKRQRHQLKRPQRPLNRQRRQLKRPQRPLNRQRV